MIGLCDCNNFFVSCQRLFQPELNGHPVAVLSGNDGCVIARSNEIKVLGVKMGVPLFQVKEIVKKHNVALFSANHRLYSDISQRVMATLRANTQGIEVYSVDEAFIDFSDFDLDVLKGHGEKLSALVKQHTGIPVSIGIASTKTLAKIASKLCKQYPALNGCCLMYRPEDVEKVLRKTPISDVWGVGRRSAKKLNDGGIVTAWDFVQTPEGWVRNQMNLPGVRTWKELQGVQMYELEDSVEGAQSMSIGRSFAHDIELRDKLHSYVTSFASTLAEKLRKQGACVGEITTYVCTNRHRKDAPQYSNSASHRFEIATDSTLEIVQAACRCLDGVFVEGYAYKKMGVVCTALVGKDSVQGSLFDDVDRGKHSKLMNAIDTINTKLGKHSIGLAAESKFKIDTNSEYLSPQYTTVWDELPRVKV